MIKGIVIFGVIFLAFIIGMFFGNFVFTGKAVEDVESKYSYTRAFCSSEECIDIIVYCSNGGVERIEPIPRIVNLSLENKALNEGSLCP